jgi:hypothetical protein
MTARHPLASHCPTLDTTTRRIIHPHGASRPFSLLRCMRTPATCLPAGTTILLALDPVTRTASASELIATAMSDLTIHLGIGMTALDRRSEDTTIARTTTVPPLPRLASSPTSSPLGPNGTSIAPSRLVSHRLRRHFLGHHTPMIASVGRAVPGSVGLGRRSSRQVEDGMIRRRTPGTRVICATPAICAAILVVATQGTCGISGTEMSGMCAILGT